VAKASLLLSSNWLACTLFGHAGWLQSWPGGRLRFRPSNNADEVNTGECSAGTATLNCPWLVSGRPGARPAPEQPAGRSSADGRADIPFLLQADLLLYFPGPARGVLFLLFEQIE